MRTNASDLGLGLRLLLSVGLQAEWISESFVLLFLLCVSESMSVRGSASESASEHIMRDKREAPGASERERESWVPHNPWGAHVAGGSNSSPKPG